MIKIEHIEANILKVTAPEKLKAGDFKKIVSQVDKFIKQHKTIRLLIDASKFNGWENIKAFEKHIGFVKTHQKKINRIAVIAGHSWQHWVASLVRMFFIHPEIKVYDKNKSAEALKWVSKK